MRTRSIAAGCTAGIVAALWAWPASAAAAVGMQEIQVPVAGISCQRAGGPPAPVTPSAEVMDAIDGTYRLSNGARLELSNTNNRLVADFGRTPDLRLVPVGPNRFESRDGNVTVSYESNAREDWIVVSYPADTRGKYVDVC